MVTIGAQKSVSNWRRSAPIRLLSNLRFGVTLIALITAYASALGGKVSLQVIASEPQDRVSPERVTLDVRIGDAAGKQISVTAADMSPQPIGPRLAVRLGPARTFYDNERPALYARCAGDSYA